MQVNIYLNCGERYGDSTVCLPPGTKNSTCDFLDPVQVFTSTYVQATFYAGNVTYKFDCLFAFSVWPIFFLNYPVQGVSLLEFSWSFFFLKSRKA